MTTSSKFRISTRSILVLVLSVATLACFLVGVFIYSSWLNASIQSTVQKQVVDNNIQTAKQLTQLFREMGIENLNDADSVSRLQTVVEGIELPNDGFVCVIEENSGLLLCHPEMRRNPGLRHVAVGKCDINVQGNDTDIVTAARQSGGIAGGNAVIGGELQMVAVANIPEYGANLLVHQRASGIERAVSKVIGSVRSIGIVVALLMTLIVFTVNYALVRSYENKLAQINEQLEETVRQRTRSLMKTRNAVIFGLAKLAESRDTDTGQHLERIRKYVTILAERFLEKAGHRDAEFVEKLALASSLHDIGKVGIPDDILLKPGRFTPEERELMERHAELGGACLRAIQKELGEDDFLELSKEIAYCHHEKWDGTGYPFKKAGESIPLSARIVALADVYDALTSKRPYKDPMPHAKAKRIIIEGRGRHFDPTIVDLFLEVEGQFVNVAEASHQEAAALSSIANRCEQVANIRNDRETTPELTPA